MASLAMPLPERQLLRWVRQTAGGSPARSGLRIGIGDDAAVMRPRPGHEIVVTTDLLLEGVHFLRAHDSAATCARRLLARALSDLGAMGAQPRAVFLSCAFPDDLPAGWERSFFRVLIRAAGLAGATLAGGDTGRSPHGILLDITGVGEVARDRALLRSGAQAGDGLYVSGELGVSALGREVAHSGLAPRNALERHAERRHQRPEARWRLGMALRNIASACLDVSDGLSTDLGRLCEESGVAALLDAEAIPTPAGLERALHGGEDYELLFSVPARSEPALRRLQRRPGFPPLTRIGSLQRGHGMRLMAAGGPPTQLPSAGWEHFARGVRET